MILKHQRDLQSICSFSSCGEGWQTWYHLTYKIIKKVAEDLQRDEANHTRQPLTLCIPKDPDMA